MTATLASVVPQEDLNPASPGADREADLVSLLEIAAQLRLALAAAARDDASVAVATSDRVATLYGPWTAEVRSDPDLLGGVPYVALRPFRRWHELPEPPIQVDASSVEDTQRNRWAKEVASLLNGCRKLGTAALAFVDAEKLIVVDVADQAISTDGRNYLILKAAEGKVPVEHRMPLFLRLS